jgi:hypothetical protein
VVTVCVVVGMFTTLGNISAGSYWTPWRWRLEALKHVGVY